MRGWSFVSQKTRNCAAIGPVEDRLNKIRNCMDIAGVRRQLELFAPEIDPRMLVRMRPPDCRSTM